MQIIITAFFSGRLQDPTESPSEASLLPNIAALIIDLNDKR